MKTDVVSLLVLCMFAVLSGESKPIHQTQLLGCAVRIPILEMRHHFNAIRHHVSEGDPTVAIIKNSILITIKPAERCCFLREVTGFYLQSVCSNWRGIIPPLARQHASPLANSLFVVNGDLQQCRCECGGDALAKIQSVRTTFETMEREEALQKAISDLGIVLSWTEDQL